MAALLPTGDLGKLKVTIKFLKDFDRTHGIENAKYDLRQNNMVTLYQDAHHEDGVWMADRQLI
jgi:hypothetical protein